MVALHDYIPTSILGWNQCFTKNFLRTPQEAPLRPRQKYLKFNEEENGMSDSNVYSDITNIQNIEHTLTKENVTLLSTLLHTICWVLPNVKICLDINPIPYISNLKFGGVLVPIFWGYFFFFINNNPFQMPKYDITT